MVRQYAPRSPRQEYGIRKSPRYRDGTKSTTVEHPKTRLFPKNAFYAKHASPVAVKNVNHRHINRPLLSPQEGRLANTSAASNLHDATYYGFEEFIDRRGTTDDEDDLANWDEETTLVELLQVEGPVEDESEKLDALAEKLRGPIADQGQKLRQQMRDIVVPAIQQVKQVHDTLENEVDISFATGLLTFDEVCKRFETLAVRQEDELKSAYASLQERTKTLFGQLEDADSRREKLWSEFEADIQECATSARTILESVPGEVEEAISRLEKKSKAMEKKASGSASKEKILKGLLERL